MRQRKKTGRIDFGTPLFVLLRGTSFVTGWCQVFESRWRHLPANFRPRQDASPPMSSMAQSWVFSKPAQRQAQAVWAASYILLGLRYSPALAAQLFRGVVSMKESSTYQA